VEGILVRSDRRDGKAAATARGAALMAEEV
jgi:hypothetical protein